jgi:hypothetical protein
MKALKTLTVLFILLLLSSEADAQRVVVKEKHGRRHYRHQRVVVKRSLYRPAKVVVYHPYWRPHYAYHRRWVYFPRYNLYWDNWRNHYVFWNGTVWISQATVPPVIVNVNLDKEKSVELREEEDDVDDVYNTNDTHKTENKAN